MIDSHAVSGKSKFEMTELNLKSGKYYTFKNIPKNLYNTLKLSSEVFPDKTAFIENGRKLTYEQLKNEADRLSESLISSYGVNKGDRVALLMVNSIDFCTAFYSLSRIGAVVLPISTKSKQIEIERLLIDSEAKILILDAKWWDNVKNILSNTKIEKCILSGSGTIPEIGETIESLVKRSKGFIKLEVPGLDDPAVLIYTSGTTGAPKGALLSNFNLLHGIMCYQKILGLTSDDSTVISVPIFHITGLAALMALFVHIGGTIVFEPYFNAGSTLKIINEHKITFFHASPTVFILLLEESDSLKTVPSLRKAACGSANMPPAVLDKLKSWIPGMDFHTVYGLTETSSPATIMPDDVYKTGKIGSSGKPIPGFDIKIIDEEGMELASNEVGELLVKGSNVLCSYWNKQQNRDAFIDGWFRTGDYARIDEDGFLYIVDRKKDMINRGGEKIYSIEVENVIYNHPAVNEVALIGVPDPVYGEVAKAIISLKQGCSASEEEIKKWVSERLAKFKVPQYIQFTEEMPHTNNGKISKTMLRDMYLN
ncbi:MAG: class I adenylate-forming enzyme family protein [Bacillota bacterium]|nr:class I adenylate-forming enzyme family protein [Bacillota bacterium]